MKENRYSLGTMCLTYVTDEATGHTAMVLLPSGKEHVLENRRKWLDPEAKSPAWELGSLCHLSLREYPQGNGAGGTLKYGEAVRRLRIKGQEKQETEESVVIKTTLDGGEYEIIHLVTYTKGEHGIEVETMFQNTGERILTLELLTSFSLDNLSPMQKEDGAYSMYLHRFHGGWSLEGKYREDSAEQLNLVGTWYKAFPESERFGVVGSFPVARWFPFGCVEDRENRMFWAAQIGVNSSWQMEFSRDGDSYSLSGGLGDAEFSGWWKEIAPGELFCAPKAYLSVGTSLEEVCQNLTGMFEKYVDRQPQREQSLPIWFNEWCTSWGNPTSRSVRGQKEILAGLPIAGIVIDAGWSRQPEGAEPQGGNGDWEYDPQQFPEGLKPVADELREQDLDLGIWMEFEVTTKGADVYGKAWERLHLTRGGIPIQTGDIRRFWDFRQPEVIEYLKEKVIGFLKENGIRYLKVDYNGSIGGGCDGAESPGEGLRQQMEAVYQFFCLIRREMPELVIENCASGGHRLEPLMMTATALSSFSDAHECREIPYIAAGLHYLILPRQSLIWAVLDPELSEKDIYYRMISTFLGRMCLSGRIESLSRRQYEILREGCSFYQECKELIRHGRSRLIRRCTDNMHHLKGVQMVYRIADSRILAVFHSFAAPGPGAEWELPEGNWTVCKAWGEKITAQIQESHLILNHISEWDAWVGILERQTDHLEN